jgi:hypothetical protein
MRERGRVGVGPAFVLAAALLSAPAAAQQADDGLGIAWGGTLLLTLQSDQTLNRANGVRPFNNTYTEPELEWFVELGKHFAVNGLFKMEQVRTVTETSAFRSEGAYVEQLYGTVRFEPLEVYGGKIHPRFGTAWDSTPGLYGTDFADDYELVEKIGVGAAVTAHLAGEHVFAVESFFNDTTFLSNSLFSRPKITDSDVIRPGRARRSDDGAGNTGGFDNFAVSLAGSEIPRLAGFTYNLGWARQEGGLDGERNEHSVVAGVAWEIPLGGETAVTPMFEYAHVANQGGADITANYVTVGIAAALSGGWAASAHATVRPVDDGATPDRYTDYLAGVSVGYDLGARLKEWAPLLEGLGVEAGYKRERVARETLNTIGALLVYEREF